MISPSLPPSQLSITGTESSQTVSVNAKSVRLVNTSTSETAYVAFETGVLTTTGYPILPSTSLFLDVAPGVTLYLIGSAALTLGYLEEA